MGGNPVSSSGFFKKGLKLCFFMGMLSYIFFFWVQKIYAEAIPPIKVSFQTPTYLLEKDQEKDEYICDPLKKDCEVNFNLEDTFSGTTLSKFSCTIDFGFPAEKGKNDCNPIAVSFPYGEYTVTFKVFEKNNVENFQEKMITIKNIKPVVEIPDIVFGIQSGLEQNSGGGYDCKTASCSVNLTVEPLFTGSYISSRYECVWDFGSGILDNSGSTTNCNPSYVQYPFSGTFHISVIIQEKGNPGNFKTGTLELVNSIMPSLLPDTSSGSTSTGTTTETLESTGSIDTPPPETSSGATQNEIPDIILTLQSPTYLVELGGGEYTCDQTKSECKGNFDVRDTFGGYVPAKYTCEIHSSLFSGETDFCNPSTIVIPEGEYSIIFKMYEKSHPENFKEKTIKITNKKPKIEVPLPIIEIQSGLKSTNSGVLECTNAQCSVNFTAESSFSGVVESNFSCLWDFGTGILVSEDQRTTCNPSYLTFPSGEHAILLEILEKANPENTKQSTLSFINPFSGVNGEETIPPLKITFQSPSYVNFETWDGETLTCDPREVECKINFSLEETFGTLVPAKYSCENDFSFPTEQESKCNPATIIFPVGKTKVIFKIFERNNPLNFQERTIFIENNQISQFGGGSSTLSTSSTGREIIVQSGGVKNGTEVTCEKESCKINLKYTKKTGEECLWNFGDLSYKEDQQTTCNPTSLSIPYGSHQIFLTIISSKTNTILDTISLTILNPFPPPGNFPPIARITLQGKTTKKMILEGNKLICYTKKSCSVNVTASGSYDPDKDNLDFMWRFGNGETSDKKNPASVEYDFGQYEIRLVVSDSKQRTEERLLVEVRDEKEQEEPLIGIIPKIRIKSIKPNPVGKDEKEYIELQNLSFSKVNLKGTIIENLKKKFTFENDFFLSSFESKKVYKSTTNLTFGNTSDKVILRFGETEIDTLSRNFKVPDGYILTHENLEMKAQQGKVLRIVDGDTVVIKLENGEEEKVRLIGIDTPETVHPNKTVQAFGKEASDYMKNLLMGKEVTLELDAENTRDIYGRLLGYILLNGEMVNKTLIQEGYARAYLRYPFKYSTEFEKLQNEAKKNKKGLWKDKELTKLISEEIKEEIPLEQKEYTNVYDYFYKIQLGTFSLPALLQQGTQLIFGVWNESKTSQIASSEPNQQKASFKKVKTDFNKIPFKITLTRLKSGLKVSGTTIPNSIVQISGYFTPIDITVGADGKFLYKIEHGLMAGNYTLSYQVKTEKKTFEISKTKKLSLLPEYVSEVDKKWQKKLLTLEKKKKKKKSKKKKSRNLKQTKISQKIQGGTSQPKEDTSSLLFLYYLLGLLGIAGGFWITKRHHKKLL